MENLSQQIIYKSQRDLIISSLLFATIFLIASFRPFNIGTDTLSYVKGFINPKFSIQNRNAGYNTFVKFLRIFSENPRYFLIVVSFLIQFPIFLSIKKYTSNPIFAMCIYMLVFYCTSLNILRQFLVISLFYSLGIEFIYEKKLIKYILLIVLLFTLHEVSLILLPLYFVTRISISKFVYLLIWIISVIVFVIAKSGAIDSVLSIVDLVFRIYLNDMPNYFSDAKNHINASASLYGVVLNQIILFISYYYVFVKNKTNASSLKVMFFNIFFWGVIFQNLFFYFVIIERMSLLFLFSLVFLLPNVLSDAKFIKYKAAFIFIFFLLFYYRFVLGGNSGVF